MHSALSSTLAFAPLLLLVAAPVDAATPPWEGPAPLSADPAAVLGAANAIATPEDHGSHVLYDDVRVEIDDAGRAKRTAYRVVRVTDQRDVERWSQVGATWAPWHQERPQLEARVIGPDGRVHTLAANTFAEQPVAGSSRDMYTDRRKLVAPLPGLRAGAVLEVVSRTADKSPFFRAGNSGRYGLLFGVPVLRSRVRVSAPRAAPLRVEVEGLDKPRLRRSTRKGRQEVTLQSGPHGSVDDVPFLTPPEAEPWPAVAWTTLPSWAAVVEGYQTLLPSVEAGRAEVADRVAAVIAGATTRRERIERLVAALHGWARYTGLELGDASIIPRRPAETLERGYGDCKDKAFLLVSALAAADIEAHLALLRVSGTDARPKRPAFGVFDHAITFVPGDPPLWIDATADRVRVGELPVQDLDRHALVIAPTTRGLVRTPPRRAQDHTITWRRDVTVQRDATTSVSETIRWTGAAEQSFRAGDHARSPEARREHWQEHTTTSWGGQLAKLDPVATPPLTTPAEVHLTVTDAPIAANEDHRYVVHLEYSRLFHWMNNVLTSAPKAKGEAEREDTEGWLDRTVDLYLQPHRMRLIYTVRAGPGLVPVDLPPSRVWELGPARVIEKFARNADDSVTVDLSYRSGPARMTPAQVRAYRAGVIEYLAAPTPTVQFEDRAQALLAAGRTVDAIAELQRLQDVEPDRAIHGQVFVEALLELGLVDEARASAAALAARLPSSRDAWFAVGRAASFGAAGIYRGSGIDIAAARDAFEEALRLEPDSPGAEENLVLVLASDPSFLPAGASGPAGRAADAGDGWVKRGIADDASRGMVVQANIAARRLERALEIAGGPTPGNLLGSGQVLSARALLETPDAALAEAQRRWPDTGQRGKALVAGGSQLTLLREYAAAAALMGPGVRALGEPNAGLWHLVSGLQRHDEADEERAAPCRAARRWLQGAIDPARPNRLRAVSAELAAKSAAPWHADGNGAAPLRLDLIESIPDSWREVSPLVVRDALRSHLACTFDGTDAEGYRVQLRPARFWTDRLQVYLTRDRGKLRVVSAGDAAPLGMEARARLARGQLAAAMRWLGWAADLQAGSDNGTVTGFSPWYTRAWRSRDPGDLAVAAALLVVEFQPTQEVLSVLRAALKGATGAEREGPEVGLLGARLRTAAPDELVALIEGSPWIPSQRGLTMHSVRMLLDASLLDDATRLTRRWHESAPANATLMDLLALCLKLQKDTRGLVALWDAAPTSARPATLNNAAWFRLGTPEGLPRATELSKRLQSTGEMKSAAELGTVALVEAENGRMLEALSLLRRRLALDPTTATAADHLYVLGRVAQQHGLHDAARSYYQESIVGDDLVITHLVDRRLGELDAAR